MTNLPDRIPDERRHELSDALTLAVGQGRIDLTEFSELSDEVWSTTDVQRFERLEALVLGNGGRRDVEELAAKAATPVPEFSRGHTVPQISSPSQNLWFGDLKRGGDMQLAATETFFLVFGNTELDLREASLSAPTTTLHITSVFGDVKVTVPPGVRVENRMSLVFGDVKADQGPRLSPGAPVVVLTGHATFGSVKITVAEPGVPLKKSWWDWLSG
ncbi:LiaF domain-containing protein [Corynebacterium kalidii]|uniref:Cell wall-active antibiotics response protein n=1 Tax=Corynebacterium kalidii TaxID=2931982 RepID=A0A9X1WI06_9CORY|nr:LiaF domain-containing protein [Corynebacterium kalidii]MCJ7857962.1 cell wall-active antibiotics response protein [Corynebacterium kalidii]